MELEWELKSRAEWHQSCDLLKSIQNKLHGMMGIVYYIWTVRRTAGHTAHSLL